VSGETVTFTAPASGASGTFAGNVISVSVTTDLSGVATAPVFTANGAIGSYAVTAAVSGVATTASFNLTNHCGRVVTNSNDSGAGSLRDAIANVCPGGTIIFAPDVTDVTLTSGELLINKILRIQGPGSNLLTVRRSAVINTPDFRIFNITASISNISGITITNGRAPDGAPAPGATFGNQGSGGGGIANFSSLTLTDVVVTGNSTGNGGVSSTSNGFGGHGGAGGGIASANTLNMTNVTVSNNSTGNGATAAFGGSGGSGGGIYFINASGAALTMTNCIVSGNTTGRGVDGTNGGFSGGTGGSGAGIFIPNGTARLTNVTINNNTTGSSEPGSAGHSGSGGSGGGIAIGSGGNVTIFNSTIKANHTGDGSGPSGQGGFSGGILNLGTLTIVGSTISGNSTGISSFGGGSIAGGMQNDGTATLINTTISGNSTGGHGGFGGGIQNAGDSLTLTNCTITGNTTFNDASGAGINISSFHPPINIKNTIVAGNGGPNTSDVNGACNSQGNNLIGRSDGSTGFSNGVNGDQVGTNAGPLNPMLAPLGDYGGATQTHLLLSGSSAINAGSNANLPQDTLDLDKDGDTAETLPFDQRGFPRVVNTIVDIGAVEVGTLNYVVIATAGSGQSATINTQFATQLKVTVTESGNPLSGIPVTFTAPASGASGTFSGSATVITDAGGVALAPVFTANGIAGSYQVVARVPDATPPATFSLTNTKGQAQVTLGNLVQTFTGTQRSVTVTTVPNGLAAIVTYDDSPTPPTNTGTYQVVATVNDANYVGQAKGTLTINKADQTINFPVIPNKTYGDPNFTINATTSSNLSLSFTASGQCRVNGTLVDLTGAGSCTLTASHAGNSNYNPADPVSQTFSIAKATRTPTLTSSANPSDFGQTVTFTARVSPSVFTGTPTGTIQFKLDGANAGAPIALDASGTVTVQTSSLTVGTHTIDADYSGDANFNASTVRLSGGQVVKSPPTVSINDISITEGNSGTKNAIFTISLSAASSLTVKADFATGDGTAAAGTDYQATSGSLTFSPFQTTRTVTVLVNGDTANEPNETFTVNLSNPQNATLLKAQGTSTIVNDDSPGVRFSINAYNFSEGAGHADITVARTGDISTPITVDYASSDQAGTAPCQTNTSGFASARCDYASAAGTVRFAAGEQSKSILIPLINDAYVEPAETFAITLRNPQGAALGISTATVTITDNDTQTATQNPINDQAFLIRQQYIDFLGREPEPDGFNFWMDRMTNCPAGQICDRTDTAQRFFESDEFKERGFYVYKLYDALLGRFPLYASEFVPEVARLNGPQTPTEQRLGKDAYLLDFMTKTEFRNLYDQYLTTDHLHAKDAGNAAAFVDALCNKAGITPASKAQLVANLQNGTKDPAHTLEDFILTPEINGDGTKFYDRARIVMQYFGFLRRDPEVAGFDFWWARVATPGSAQFHDYRELVNNFLRSDEYNFRFAFLSAP
jgi:hypothetical protein